MPDKAVNVSKNIRKYKKGELLFCQNDATQELFIVKSGKIRIFKKTGNTEIDLDIAEPGAVIGEIAIIDKGKRSASGVAQEDTEVIAITAQEFDTVFNKMPDWFRKIALILVQRLREVDSKINRAADVDFSNHIAAVISLVAATYQNSNSENSEINCKFLEDEIVDLLNIQPSETLKVLECLQKEGTIQLEHSKIIITQMEKIEKMAGQVFTAN